MAPVAMYLRVHGIVFPHIDNWLIMADSKNKTQRVMSFTFCLLMDLGLCVNVKKLHMQPERTKRHF